MLTFYFSGAQGSMRLPEVLTAGMVGKQVMLEFSPEWEGLAKTVVFSDGVESRDVIFTGNPVTIPAKILENPLRRLTVGIYGVDGAQTMVIPTVRALGPVILPGAALSGDPAEETELALWEQLLGLIGDLSALQTEEKSTLVGAINEVQDRADEGLYYVPAVSPEGILSWSNNGSAPNPDPVCIRGADGQDGKSAYAYARESGFTGTEETFAELLACVSKPVQPDWNRNDPEQSDYVKNRTHWEEGSVSTVRWDGSTMGRRTIELPEGTYYKISDACPTEAEILVGTVEYANGETVDVTGKLFTGFADGQARVGSYLYVINRPLVYEGNVTDPESVGIYGRISGEMYPSAFTYGAVVVHPLDEKYIPDTIARTKDMGSGGLPLPPAAAVGQFITVAAVDENGRVTATEAITLADAEGVAF